MNAKEKELFDFLVEYYTDEVTARKIINGGDQGYCYGGCGYIEVDPDDEFDQEFIQEQESNLISDVSLPGTGYFLVGGMI
ncbi:hypothetical protein AB9M75_04155 [Lactobacillus sp. AN1001]